MTVDEPRRWQPYRLALLRFIADWNTTYDRASLVVAAPQYEDDDPVLVPAIAAVVHGLAYRAQVPVPGWVRGQRAPEHVMLFIGSVDTPYSRMVRRRAPASVCAYHRVWFHHRLLDKGTPDWWLPWWEVDEDDPALEGRVENGPDTALSPDRVWPGDPATTGTHARCCFVSDPVRSLT